MITSTMTITSAFTSAMTMTSWESGLRGPLEDGVEDQGGAGDVEEYRGQEEDRRAAKEGPRADDGGKRGQSGEGEEEEKNWKKEDEEQSRAEEELAGQRDERVAEAAAALGAFEGRLHFGDAIAHPGPGGQRAGEAEHEEEEADFEGGEHAHPPPGAIAYEIGRSGLDLRREKPKLEFIPVHFAASNDGVPQDLLVYEGFEGGL